MEMLVGKQTGVITKRGTSDDKEFIKGTFEEVEVDGGFKLVGTLENGEKVEAFLTEGEYFDGVQFGINNVKKPKVELIGQDGNIYFIMAKCTKALTKSGQHEKGFELVARVQFAKSYDEALRIVMEYVDIV